MEKRLLASSYVVLSVLIVVTVCGCFGESAYPAYSYSITINGLADFTNDNATEILIPVPMMDDKPLLDIVQANSQSGDWDVTLVDTDYGKMLSLKTNMTNLSDINIKYTKQILQDRPVNQYDTIMNRSLEAPLRPISSGNPLYSVYQEIPDNIRAANFSLVKNYTSYVGIDKNVRPLRENNHSIEIILDYGLFRGMSPGRGGSQDWAGVHELIPAGVTGYIPVTTSVWSTIVKN